MKSFVLFFSLFIFTSFQFEVKAQLWKDIKEGVNKGKDLINGLTEMTRSYKKLKDEVGKNSNTYNKNVIVAKGNPGTSNPNPDNIPEKKMNKLKFKDGGFTNLVWEPANFFDGQLFPSAIICMASYKGELKGIIEAISRPLGFSIYSTKSNIPLRWEIESVDKTYFDRIGGTYMYEQAGKQVYLDPPIPWNYERLSKAVSSAPMNVYFRLFDEDGNKVEKLETLQLRSVNDCIYGYKDVDMKFMFSAFVQEEHEAIDGILRSALNTKMVDSWFGYQGSAADVDKQISAIWRVLHERGFVYSSITATTGDVGNVRSQAVRTMENALKTNQANCVDGTVVFASILKKIGIDPIMVLVPGHCFLGYYADEKHSSVKFLETTMLSNKYVYSGGKKVAVLTGAKTNAEKNKAYTRLFEYARDYAFLEYTENMKKERVTAIDVEKYRQLIKPIPFY
nr:hypothetical protein [Pedobacter sp. ASV19]